MAEQVFASIGEHGMTLTTITGSQGALGNLYIKGTQFISGASSQTPRELTYNNQNQLVYSGTDHKARRGLTLAIFDSSMKVVSMATYDVYTDDVARNNLATKMKEITSTQLGVIISFDAIRSNSTLDAAFDYFRSGSWPRTGYLGEGNNFRSSYCCVICGRKKAVIAEKHVGHAAPDPDAIIELSFSNPLQIGYSGFGDPIISDEEIYQTNGTTEKTIKNWFTKKNLSDLKLKEGDEFLFSSLGEVDAIAAADGGYVLYNMEFYNNSGAVISSFKERANSVEGWQEVLIRNKIPSGSASVTISAVSMKADGTVPVGTCYVKNTVMSLADNTQAQATAVSFGVYGSSVKSYSDSLGNFGHYDPKGYYEEAKSERNLIGNRNLDPATPQPVRWMNRILDDDKERIVMETDQDMVKYSSYFDLDPKKFYYVCAWVNKQEKTAGEFMLGIRQYTDGGSMLELKSTNGKSTSAYMYAQKPKFDDLEDRQWYLMQGFILPHDIDQARANEFIEANKEFYGWDDLYGNGIGLSDEGNGYYGWISNKDAVKARVNFLDYYNKGAKSRSLWALPMVRELRIGSVDVDDGMLTSISLSG